jgi:hypothetical protein
MRLTCLLVAATAAAALTAAAFGTRAASGLPSSCPRSAVIGGVLRTKVVHVSSYVGPISSTTLAGMGPAPSGAHYKKTAQKERTCTYSGAPTGPITITFVAPMTLDAFRRSRASLSKSGVAVATVAGIGDTAWAARTGGVLFVLKGNLDIVISAPRTSVARLRTLADQIV